MDKKMEIVKKELKAFKINEINEIINGYYIRFRKSKSNKRMLNDFFENEEVMNEDGFFRIGTYEVRLTDEAFERIYKDYMDKIFSRSF